MRMVLIYLNANENHYQLGRAPLNANENHYHLARAYHIASLPSSVGNTHDACVGISPRPTESVPFISTVGQ